MRSHLQMVDLADPSAALQFAATLAARSVRAAAAAGGQEAGQSTCGER
jgi:hypothetical protein